MFSLLTLALCAQLNLASDLKAPAAPVKPAPSTLLAAPYTLPPLPYPFEALEPAVDRETMVVHHGKHHAGFVNNLNQLSVEIPELQKGDIESLLPNISKFPPAVRNNLGGHYNHALFWQVMAPPGEGGKASGLLLKAIDEQFGSYAQFQVQFADAGAKRFGSGWAWLIVRPDGKLAITSTPNQDNPLMDVAEVQGIPVLALDVCEHAYYLKYRNLRGDYIKAWWEVVNWNEVSRRFDAALKVKP